MLSYKGLLHPGFEFLIVSGDFTWGCGDAGFEAAKVFIDELAPFFGKNGIVVIPGNHDVQLGNPMVIGRLSLPTQKEEAEARFRDFLSSIGTHVATPNKHLSVVKRLQSRGAEKGLIIIGLNSCRVERRDAQGWGYVGIDQIYEVASKLSDPTNPDRARQDDIVLAVLHHNPLPIWDLGLEELVRVPDDRKFSFLMDAGSVLGFLSDLGVGAVLHGHTHTLSEKRVQGYGESEDSVRSTTLVMGAGSFGIDRKYLDGPHHFHVIEVDDSSSFGTLRFEDLTSTSTESHSPRAWTVERGRPQELPRSWNTRSTNRVLANRGPDKHQTAVNYEISQSWALLRTKRTRPAQWPVELAALIEQVQSINPALAAGDIAKAIDDLFDNPPSENDICNWMLAQYLARTLR